jgi:putative hydrolase of the HAD superfamily
MNAVRAPPAAADTVRDLHAFGEVETWIFDLDNTLYPRHVDLFHQLIARMRDYIQGHLEVGPDEAARLQRDYYRRYGTTLHGLMQEHGVAPHDFLEYVHDIDYSAVEANPALAAAIEALPGRKFILTDGLRAHAERVTERLGIADSFDDIFDIVSSNLLPKHHRETYEGFIAATGMIPQSASMFEDLSRNLEAPAALGMATILVVPDGAREVIHEDWEMEGHDALHVHFLTDDLAAFLDIVLQAIAVSRDSSR